MSVKTVFKNPRVGILLFVVAELIFFQGCAKGFKVAMPESASTVENSSTLQPQPPPVPTATPGATPTPAPPLLTTPVPSPTPSPLPSLIPSPIPSPTPSATSIPSPNYSNPTPRTNKRFVCGDGNDSWDGTSKLTAWKSLQANISKIPADTEVIFCDGTYTFTDAVFYSSRSSKPLPVGVTIRPETYRGALLKGPNNPNGSRGGDAFDILGGVKDLEVWGFRFEDWKDVNGNGVFLIEYDNEDIRIIGNKFANNGSEPRDHIVYLSGGKSYATTLKNWVIEGNEATMAAGTGAFVHLYAGPTGPHEGLIRNNIVRGNSSWAIIQDRSRTPGTSANIEVMNNDFRGSFVNAVIHWTDYYGDTSFDGVDSSFVVSNNILVNNLRAGAVLDVVNIPAPRAQHQPTLRNNVYSNSAGGQVLRNITLGTGDRIGAP